MKFLLPVDTPEGQKKAVTADDGTITVGAGAGTGKTWVLSNRYLRILIEDEKILPSNILTLTFTETAAADMKRRIEERIKDELKNYENSDRKRKILEGFNDSWISTIHSFAGRLIRESGLSLDIDPRASVISTQQEEDFWEQIKNAVEFANLRELARINGDKTLRKISEFLDQDRYFNSAVSKWGSDKLTELARSSADLHSSSGHTWLQMLEWAETDPLIESTKSLIKNIIKDEWLNVWNVWSEMTLPAAKNPEGSGGKLNKLLEWQKFHSPDDEEALKEFYEKIVFDKSIKSTAYEPFTTAKKFLGTTLGKWRESKSELIGNITQTINNEFLPEELIMRRTLLRFCAVSWGMWDIMKRRRGLLSFSDMILHAKKALENNGVNKTFDHILVDEFQDTDPLQFEMIKSLINPQNNTSLFAVGDPKQSIYKFRHADPSLFAETIKNADIKIELDVSFRTRSSLLTKINKIFASLWREGLGRSESMRDLKFEPLKPAFEGTERENGTMPDFQIILARKESNSGDLARKSLAENIAFNISSWVKEGRTIWDKAEKVLRPVKFSDFAILSRSRTYYPIFEEAFEKFNIKTIQDRSMDYFSRGEINDIVCLLRAAADFNDDFAVSGFVMSPFSGLSEDQAIGDFLTLIDADKRPIKILMKDFPEIYSRLEYFSIIGENKGALGIIEILDRDRKWLSSYRENDRLRVLRNLRLALSSAGSFQNYGISSLTAFAEYLTRSVRNKVSSEEPKWHNDNENAVKLCAVHSAKGLEYPVAVIFEGRTRKNSEKRSVRPSKNLGMVFTDLPDEFKAETKASEWDKLLSEQGDTEEETRLFYVAATRAQDSLIYCGLVNSKDDEPDKNTWTKFLLDNVKKIDDLSVFYVEASENSEIKIKNGSETEKSLTPLKLPEIKNYLRQFSASSFSLFEWCPFSWRRKYRQGLELSWDNSEMNFDFENDDEDREIGGSELGSLAHWILSRWPVNDNYESELEYYLNDNEIITKLPALIRNKWRDAKSKETLRKWLMKFAVSDLGFRLRHEKNVKREYHFRIKLSESETSLAGAMDAFINSDSENSIPEIIDYKITSIKNAPRGLYESQLDFYALSAHELTGCERVKILTAFLREGKIFERICDNFSDIRERVLKASEICASGFCEPYIKNCVLCPFKKGCVKNKNA